MSSRLGTSKVVYPCLVLSYSRPPGQVHRTLGKDQIWSKYAYVDGLFDDTHRILGE